VTPGIGTIHTQLTTRNYPDDISNPLSARRDIKTTQNSIIYRIAGEAGFGYNGPKYFAGTYFSTSASKYKQENVRAVNSNFRFNFEVFLGYRLPAF
jgi:hypothetical protein